MKNKFLSVMAAATTILTASAASAATATVDGITVSDLGRVDLASPNFAQPGVAQIQIGQVNGPGNPPEAFRSVVFTTGSSDFEYAVAAVPEPSTWAMLGVGFAGLAFGAYKRPRRDRLAPALG